MRLRIRRGRSHFPGPFDPYRPNLTSTFLSVLLHVGVILGLSHLPADDARRQPTPRYKLSLLPPEERKIVWYDFRKKKTLEIDPVVPIGASPDTRGRELSKETVIALPPNAPEAKQLIWQPRPSTQTPEEIPSPNLVALAPTGPVLPAKQQPRQFVPPPVAERAAPAR